MPVDLTASEVDFVRKQIDQFVERWTREQLNPLYRTLRWRQPPPSIREFLDAVERLRSATGDYSSQPKEASLGDDVLTLLKAILFFRERLVAQDVDERRSRTTNREAIALLDEELVPFDCLHDLLREFTPVSIPHLADFLTLEMVEQWLQERGQRLAQRVYDEKFHLLQAPALLLPDIAYFRETSAVRGNPIAVGFLDIDDFKRLNTTYGHESVDADVLPILMRSMEAFAYARGFAYRMGGEEYVVLLGNGQGATDTFEQLRLAVSQLRYRGVEEHTTVSIGVCVVSPTCPLSDRQVRERANRAMRHAKESGKNCVATYMESGFSDKHLVVSTPNR